MMVLARAYCWPSFDFRGAGSTAGFGGAIALSSLFYFVQTQTDVIIAGRRFDAQTVGIYTTALFLAQIFVNRVVPPLNEVAFTALARIQSDHDAFAKGFLVSVRAIMLLAIPFCVGMSLTAEPLINVLLGAKWSGVAPVLRIVGLAMPWMALQVLFAPATNAVGRPGIALRNSIVGAVLMPIGFLIGMRWGIEGMAMAWLIVYPVIAAITAFSSIRAIHVSFGQLASAVAPPTLAAFAMALIVHLANRQIQFPNPVLELAALSGIGAAIYLGSLAVFARDRLKEFVALVRNR
jgi:O-antigen/teichoic acid export membrane protein